LLSMIGYINVRAEKFCRSPRVYVSMSIVL
jgi:hypothetical protein